MSGSEGWVANHECRKMSHQPLLQPLAQLCKCTSCRIFTRKHHIPYTSWKNCSNFWHSTSQQISMGCIIKVWVLKLFVAGKQADLMLPAGDYHMKFNIKNLGTRAHSLKRKEQQNIQVCRWSSQHCEMFQQFQLAFGEGLAEVES